MKTVPLLVSGSTFDNFGILRTYLFFLSFFFLSFITAAVGLPTSTADAPVQIFLIVEINLNSVSSGGFSIPSGSSDWLMVDEDLLTASRTMASALANGLISRLNFESSLRGVLF